ncbi:hypothetical protein [Piscirickettsia litoralis]|uniref:hypothetical protein n=1 Tax=Piscirickettsia litoralis TaxID=1891921 RepID=UPI0022864510|nr:hypothetical protein [Piscirickettsia litoralis]
MSRRNITLFVECHFFADLPGIGWLFQSRSHSTVNKELLIFVTPKIMPTLKV